LPPCVNNSQKRLILIRHGESTWNEVFNSSFDWRWPIRFLWAVARECSLFVTRDSVFVDAPLSERGTSQAQELREILFNNESKENLTKDLSSLKNSEKKTILLSSPLRRCIETISLGLFPRLDKSLDKIMLLSYLHKSLEI